MCYFVYVGDFACGHMNEGPTVSGIPRSFWRPCPAQVSVLTHCQATHVVNETIPWMCSDCHWKHVEEVFVPLRDQNQKSSQQMRVAAEACPADVAYLAVQRQVVTMEQAFLQARQKVENAANEWHQCRDKVLRCFLGEHFEALLSRAPNHHRPISLRLSTNPYVRDDRSVLVQLAGPNFTDISQHPNRPAGGSSPPPYEDPPREGTTDGSSANPTPSHEVALPARPAPATEPTSPQQKARLRLLLADAERHLLAVVRPELEIDVDDQHVPDEALLDSIEDWMAEDGHRELLVGSTGEAIANQLRRDNDHPFVTYVLRELVALQNFRWTAPQVRILGAHLMAARLTIVNYQQSDMAAQYELPRDGRALDRLHLEVSNMPPDQRRVFNAIKVFEVLACLRWVIGELERRP